ncbi:hypothetical protein AB1Y20_022939 [Prymnesium parvum]|uniref:Uncharacterized protein n=1 Tax=Prymnesium parvum TaxID=97485 RepID=A0AB34JEY1_PRYPA
MPYSGTIAALAFACLVVCMYPLLRWLRWQWAWRKLPVISGASKVTHTLLMRAASEYSHAVRLPGRHGVLITDPTLALHLLKSFGIRDVSSYQRYRSFLGSALVALPSATDSQVSLHTRVRAALLPLFTASHVRLVHDSLLGCTTRLLTRLSTSTSRDAPLYRAMQHFAVDATAAAFLGQPLEDADARRIIVLLEEFLSEAEHDAGGSSSALRTWWMWLLEATQTLRGRPREGAPKKSTRLMNTFERALDRVLATQEEVAASGKLCVLSALKGLKREARSQSVGKAPRRGVGPWQR